jgi:tubulin-folding cofactor B
MIDYAKRDNTYLAYKKKMQAQDPNWKSIFQKNNEQKSNNNNNNTVDNDTNIPKESNESVAARCKLGSRCELTPGGRRGTIRYVGPVIELSPGPIEIKQNEDGSQTNVWQYWIGIELDEPTGKHDGIIHGKRYFQTKPKSAAFAKPHQVAVGDYPERDPLDEDSDEENNNKQETKDDLYDEL